MISFVFVCFIVPAVVAVAVDMVRDRISKKKVVVCEDADLEVRPGPPMPAELRAFIDAREKAKNGS